MSATDARRSALWRAALRLERQGRGAKRSRPIPTMFLFTDPDRTADPVKTALSLPRGTGVVFRGFGRVRAETQAFDLARTCKRRKLLLLVGSDETLAWKVGAGGVHLPERDLWRARRLRQRHPRWVITGAAHTPMALRTATALSLDAVFLSAVFESRSLSAGAPIGPVRLAAMLRGVRAQVYALGGVNGVTARRLPGTGAVGLASVEALEPLAPS